MRGLYKKIGDYNWQRKRNRKNVLYFDRANQLYCTQLYNRGIRLKYEILKKEGAI